MKLKGKSPPGRPTSRRKEQKEGRKEEQRKIEEEEGKEDRDILWDSAVKRHRTCQIKLLMFLKAMFEPKQKRTSCYIK
jgi:hypothetical protein